MIKEHIIGIAMSVSVPLTSFLGYEMLETHTKVATLEEANRNNKESLNDLQAGQVKLSEKMDRQFEILVQQINRR